MNGQLVFIIPVGDSNLPGFGGGIGAQPGHPSTGPIYGGGHPGHDLPGSPGHPANRPPGIPPNVIWPPRVDPGHPDNALPPELSGGKPTQPIQIVPGTPLPPDTALILVYSEKGGWKAGAIHLAQPK